MAGRLPVATAAEVLRKLSRDGWYVKRQSGTSHAILGHQAKRGRPVLPLHSGATLRPGVMASILKQAGLTPDEFRRL